MERLYFGHPKGSYNTKFETIALGQIRRDSRFEGYRTIVNPNSPQHEQGAEEYRREHATESSMLYFLEIAGSCDAGVFLLMPDGRWGSGTHIEAQVLLKLKRPVWSLSFLDGFVMPVTSIPTMRVMTKEETSDRNSWIRVRAITPGH